MRTNKRIIRHANRKEHLQAAMLIVIALLIGLIAAEASGEIFPAWNAQGVTTNAPATGGTANQVLASDGSLGSSYIDIADTAFPDLNAGDSYTNFGDAADDTINELLDAIDTAAGGWGGGGSSEWTETAGVLSQATGTDRVNVISGANTVPFTITEQLGGQTADLFHITSDGGSAGDLLTVDDEGDVIIGNSPGGYNLSVAVPDGDQEGIKIDSIGTDGYLLLRNNSSVSGDFSPTITGLGIDPAKPGMYFRGLCNPGDDNGTVAVLRFLAMQSDLTPLLTRPIATWQSYDGSYHDHMLIDANGLVGFGESTPVAGLHVTAPSGGGTVAARIEADASQTADIVQIIDGDGSTELVVVEDDGVLETIANVNLRGPSVDTKVSVNTTADNYNFTDIKSGKIDIYGLNPYLALADQNGADDSYKLRAEDGDFEIINYTDSGRVDLAIDGDGLVGFGESTPVAGLHVTSPSGGGTVAARIEADVSQTADIVQIIDGDGSTELVVVEDDGLVVISDGSDAIGYAGEAGDLYVGDELEVDGTANFLDDVVLNGVLTINDEIDTVGSISSTGSISAVNFTATSGFIQRSVTAGITASATQSQGQQPLTTEYNEVDVVATSLDVVTLPSCYAGRTVWIRNNGANILKIYPASGDKINGGIADAADNLSAGSSVVYRGIDATNWYE